MRRMWWTYGCSPWLMGPHAVGRRCVRSITCEVIASGCERVIVAHGPDPAPAALCILPSYRRAPARVAAAAAPKPVGPGAGCRNLAAASELYRERPGDAEPRHGAAAGRNPGRAAAGAERAAAGGGIRPVLRRAS